MSNFSLLGPKTVAAQKWGILWMTGPTNWPTGWPRELLVAGKKSKWQKKSNYVVPQAKQSKPGSMSFMIFTTVTKFRLMMYNHKKSTHYCHRLFMINLISMNEFHKILGNIKQICESLRQSTTDLFPDFFLLGWPEKGADLCKGGVWDLVLCQSPKHCGLSTNTHAHAHTSI